MLIRAVREIWDYLTISPGQYDWAVRKIEASGNLLKDPKAFRIATRYMREGRLRESWKRRLENMRLSLWSNWWDFCEEIPVLLTFAAGVLALFGLVSLLQDG